MVLFKCFPFSVKLVEASCLSLVSLISYSRLYVWEIMTSTLKKMSKHTNKVFKIMSAGI